jgi:hypothetical protein
MTTTEMSISLGDHPLEFRLGLIYLRAAAADGTISEEELQRIADYLGQLLEELGSSSDAIGVLKSCFKALDDEALLQESVGLLGEYLTEKHLLDVIDSLQRVSAADGVADEEAGFVCGLVEAWRLGARSGG